MFNPNSVVIVRRGLLVALVAVAIAVPMIFCALCW